MMQIGYSKFIKNFFFTFGVLVCIYSCSNYNQSKEKTLNSPNIIFILADDQGWNGTSVQMMHNEIGSKSDYFETPNLELLAEEGMRFSDAYSSAPVCAPSRYSIQFGKTPARLSLIRVGMNTDHIDHMGFISIPKALKKLIMNTEQLILVNGVWEVILQFWVMTSAMVQLKISTEILIIIKVNGKM